MERHLRSKAIMIEVTNCDMKCSDLTSITVGCMPLRYNGDPGKKLHLPRCSWTAASSVKQQEPSSSRRPLTPRPPSIDVLTISLRLLRPASLTLSTSAGKVCCDFSNLLCSFARLRQLRVLKGGNRVATSTTKDKQKVDSNSGLYTWNAIYVQ